MSQFERALETLRALPKPERRAAMLLANPAFQNAVELAAQLPDAALLDHANGPDNLAACVALEALKRRAADPVWGPRLSVLLDASRGPRGVFLLRALDRHVEAGLLLSVLQSAGVPWKGAALEELKALAQRRRDEHVPVFTLPDSKVEAALAIAEAVGLASAAGALKRMVRHRDIASSLGRIGRIRRSNEVRRVADGIHEDAGLTAEIDALAAAIDADKPLLVVGERGSGRRSRLRAAAGRLAFDGWMTFEAGSAEVNAGMTYVGELEGRVRFMVQTLAAERVLWIVPQFEELLWAGSYRRNPVGALDHLMQGLSDTVVHVAGVLEPHAYDRLLRERPGIRDVFDVVRVEPLDEARTLHLAALAAPRTDRAVLREALALGRHFLGDAALPGALFSLLAAMRRRLDDPDAPLAMADVLATISERSGLPPALLDERERLDIGALRAFFTQRVIGQPEAVECMVERVALVKAGLTDPTRPQAVLLFVGPTGTGKTEIAKALAEFLFGSPERMVRIDMSEYQNRGSAWRMLGDADEEREDRSLVGRIRRQPFSVVLLDEFEKADTSVWDVFLQVFDDGRLSDARGAVADFRHAVIIMTSNLGSRVRSGGLGFSPTTGDFNPASVEQAVTKAFRPEFLNRIDRTIVFRPLTRPVMREILGAELESVLVRRGLRGRDWAVEFDDSALEFLLAQGFTPDLGARPLKRAVERHFLTPLALAIADHDYPEGDQFLFVHAGNTSPPALKVTFEDPDGPEPIGTAPAETTVRTLAREGGPGLDLLERAYEDVSARVEDDEWQDAKTALLARLGEPGFWDDEGRFGVLSEIELRDRIESGLRSARSLMNRLRNARRPPSALVRRAAQRLLLLDDALEALAAGEPADARLRVEGDPEFGPRIVAMYRGWAQERGMRLEVVEERAGRRLRFVATVSGFAALRVLMPENGFHVLELPDGRGGYDRRRVRVTVFADGAEEPTGGRATIVRRYRERPTPLVRDAVRGWRTGRLEAVLAGGFDLVE